MKTKIQIAVLVMLFPFCVYSRYRSALVGWMNNGVMSLMVFNNELIAGGCFITAGSITASYAARWDGSNR